ncbi:hypothetical protein AB1Y20_019702 [Prymnesium parvum]|uniref:GMP phosphodiesterase delta subunit domain-containing protein n=1 Tax=Prymnesium parvum TaxID=97485 RepID=A0AB34JVD3_PRYPA|mmetsp:Transcript_18119/g.45433  ORF Transcript_18119/g.45433 Transcript_18119/m.45433 type:complete len:203 (-) Transcript_18119:416-1024(-)
MVGECDMQGLSLDDTAAYYAPAADEVLTYTEPTPGYCCPLSANIYGIEFESFRIRDYETGQCLFEVSKDPEAPPIDLNNLPPEMEDQVRCISYDFGAEFLDLKTVGTTLQFAVGPNEVPNFRMIERHYFRNHLIKSFDFNFGFCIPNSVNTWEAIYDLPELDPELKQQLIDFPWETQSDSFYYVGETMIMHNKAKYAYTLPP